MSKTQNYSKMEEVSISRIYPEGWLREFLLLQKNGLTGNLDKIGFPFDRISWAAADIDTTSDNDNPGWWVYEQTAYLLDGVERCGALLRDEELRKKAADAFAYVLQNADPDGYLGPKFLKEGTDGFGRWAHVVFFRALMAEYSRTGDEKLLFAVCRHYLDSKADFSVGRDVLNVEIILWAYLSSGDEKLLEMAIDIYKEYNQKCKDDNCVSAMLSDKKAYAHGVTYNEFCKLGAILYICTGEEVYLEPVLKAYEKIERYQMLPDGLHCSNEFLLDNDYMQTHEMCDVVDYTWTLGYLLMATGDGRWADRIERCIFNAGIGAVDEEFKSLQYLSGLNQVIADSGSNHGDFFKGQNWMSYRPIPAVECCAGNVNRFMPNYCARMWMQKENDVFAALHGPAMADFIVNGCKVSIRQENPYPFSDSLCFRIATDKPCEFHFHIRIPGWCEHADIMVNEEPVTYTTVRGFAQIRRVFQDGDCIRAALPSEIKIRDYQGQGRYVEKGPLVYAYNVKAVKNPITDTEKTTADFPAYDMYPDASWNYALCAEQEDGASPVFLDTHTESNPWTLAGCPYKIQIAARKIKDWDLEHADMVRTVKDLYKVPWKWEVENGEYVFTPRFPEKAFVEKHGYEEREVITLVPMAVTQLRMTVFPKEWK